MKNLILDVDGVIVDLITPLLEKYNKLYGTKYIYRDIKDYNLSKTLEHFNTKHLDDYELYRCTDFIDNRIPDMLIKLQKKYNIYFVTSVPLICEEAVRGRLDFFKQYLFNQSNGLENLIFSKYKNIIPNFRLNTVIVDDCIGNLDESIFFIQKQIVFNQPWNQEEKIFQRVNNWNELYKELMEY